MNNDLKLQKLLDALNGYLDNMPLEGSTDYACFSALWTELLAYRPALPEPQAKSTEPRELKPADIDRRFNHRMRTVQSRSSHPWQTGSVEGRFERYR